MTGKKEEFNLITIYGDEIKIITDEEKITRRQDNVSYYKDLLRAGKKE